MGYCYSQSGGLLCDFCGGIGAKKYRCPFGYCQPLAACPACHEKHAAEFGRAVHRANGCERAAQRYAADEAAGAAAMAAGEYLLVAGLNAPGDMVHAIFRGKDGEKGKLIPYAIYQRRTEFINCMTIAKFEQLAGRPLADAPTAFH
jgi:hypothetical protein